MLQRIPQGVVEKQGEIYVGSCYEVGTTCEGRTVEETFANLRELTWRALEHPAAEGGDTREVGA
jgi:hypothetical protein